MFLKKQSTQKISNQKMKSKETFKYSMETQFEANANTKIGSAAIEHLHLNKSILPKGDRADILVLCLHQHHKNGLYLKGSGVV